jgi:hypothetical protein
MHLRIDDLQPAVCRRAPGGARATASKGVEGSNARAIVAERARNESHR